MSGEEIGITFEIPNDPEPIGLVRAWARKLRSYHERGVQGVGEGAGTYYVPKNTPDEGPTVPGSIRLRVMVPRGRKYYQEGLWLLTEIDLWCLVRSRRPGGKRYPPLYDAICYVREKPRVEIWQAIPALYARRIGDCEDLACARAAERLMVGDACRPTLLGKPKKSGGILYHIVVKNPDGSIEDPSATLGMRLGRDGDRTIARCRRILAPGEGKLAVPS